jgi:hypothetical protein
MPKKSRKETEENNPYAEADMKMTLFVLEARAAVNDLGPHIPPKYPFLYWPSHPQHKAAEMLIKRSKVRTHSLPTVLRFHNYVHSVSTP